MRFRIASSTISQVRPPLILKIYKFRQSRVAFTLPETLNQHLSVLFTVPLRSKTTKRQSLTQPLPGGLTLTSLWGFWVLACISCWELHLFPPSAMLSAGESSASYRWMCFWVRGYRCRDGCVGVRVSTYSHRIHWTQNTEAYFSFASVWCFLSGPFVSVFIQVGAFYLIMLSDFKSLSFALSAFTRQFDLFWHLTFTWVNKRW